MTKKFDVIIGNPPYQEAASGSGTRDTPVYNLFMDAAYEVASRAVLITPARFLFNAGFTPKAWNLKMLADQHLSVPVYVPNSDDLFPGTNINGGIAVTYRDAESAGEAIGTFTHYPQLTSIVSKVVDEALDTMDPVITSSRSFRYTEALYEDHPDARDLRPAGNAYLISTNAFDQFTFLFTPERPTDGHEYVRVLGLDGKRRSSRWIRREYVAGPDNFSKYKVVVPASRGHLGKLGENPALILGEPMMGLPQDAVTQTFITIGSFDYEVEAEAALRYLKTKFARTMLGVLKVTQHNPAATWKYVPLQNFSPSSDIDWTKSIPEIDQQLYAKYELDDDEIAFIEEKVKPMA